MQLKIIFFRYLPNTLLYFDHIRIKLIERYGKLQCHEIQSLNIYLHK